MGRLTRVHSLKTSVYMLTPLNTLGDIKSLIPKSRVLTLKENNYFLLIEELFFFSLRGDHL